MKRKGIVLTKQDHVLKGKEKVKENKFYLKPLPTLERMLLKKK